MPSGLKTVLDATYEGCQIYRKTGNRAECLATDELELADDQRQSSY